MKKSVLIAICLLAIILPYVGMWLMYRHYEERISSYDRASFIIVDKQTMQLRVYDRNGDCIADFPMACGRAYGNKIEKGDNRTPEGIFRISDIQNSSDWKHDFGDGKGEIHGSYGPWFIRLSTEPHKGIGIHGTHLPLSIGTRATEGCIRLSNNDIKRLRELSYCGLTVIVLPSENDIKENSKHGTDNM